MLRRKRRWRHRFRGLSHFASAVKPLGKMTTRRNRVASVFFTRPRVRFGLARALHEPPTSGGYVASHAAETPPPRPRHSLSNWESATLAPACAARPTASVDMPSWRRSEWLEWLGTARSRCKSRICAFWWCVDISGREGFARFWYNVLHGSSL